MITRSKKEELVKNLAEKFKKAKAIIFTDFSGVKVPELEDLRAQLREQDIEYQIIKKSLLKRVYPQIDYQGPIAVALADDEIALSKILYNFNKIKIIGGRDLDLTKIEELAKLLSKEELLIKFVYLLKNNLNKLILCLKNIKA
ncbi:MAG: 50S ribosomal protein L10 [bacterium]